MSSFEIILLAIALGVDCCVVSFSQGLVFTSNRRKNSFLLALTMGIFQGLMPAIGYVFANLINKYVETFSHWLVFAIFLILGVKFIFEAFQEKEEEKICCLGFACLMTMGLATSIDALAAGASLKFSETKLLLPALVIGTVSFLMSLFGFWFGNLFKNFPSKILEVSGGVILIILAVKALF